MRTLINRAISLLAAQNLIFLTGTPMMNRPINLHGLLYLIWRESVHGAANLELSEDAYTLARDEQMADLEAGTVVLTRVMVDRYMHFLNLITFTKLVRPIGGGQVEVTVANRVFPPILRFFQLRRIMADVVNVNGVQSHIGSSISPYKIVTVELQMDAGQSRRYFKAHESHARYIATSTEQHRMM